MKITDSLIEIYCGHERISSHKRFPSYARNKYDTYPEDIPDLRNVNVYQMFENGGTIDVTAPDGTVTTLSSGDFTAAEGSLDVTLSASYLEGMEDGDYTMTVTFVVAPGYEKTSAPSSFTVVSPAPAGSDSPATVESIALVVLSNILTKSSSCSSRLPARSTPSAAGEWQSNGIFYDS